MNAKNCTTHHYACECREAKFAEIARDNETLREDLKTLASHPPRPSA